MTAAFVSHFFLGASLFLQLESIELGTSPSSLLLSITTKDTTKGLTGRFDSY
jgi:hypothetical protein